MTVTEPRRVWRNCSKWPASLFARRESGTTPRHPGCRRLQEWGKHSWNVAAAPPISGAVAAEATEQALAELDSSFFRVRFDRLTPSEKRYMRAMAELGPGPHRSGDVAELLQKKVTTVAPTRNSLIAKGMIYSPSHGDTAFTVPLFDGFMKRIMPRFSP
jgi:hypothetical protein